MTGKHAPPLSTLARAKIPKEVRTVLGAAAWSSETAPSQFNEGVYCGQRKYGAFGYSASPGPRKGNYVRYPTLNKITCAGYSAAAQAKALG